MPYLSVADTIALKKSENSLSNTFDGEEEEDVEAGKDDFLTVPHHEQSEDSLGSMGDDWVNLSNSSQPLPLVTSTD